MELSKEASMNRASPKKQPSQEATAQNLTVKQIKSIAEKFRNMPAVENEERVPGKRETIKMLYTEITGLMERGYSIEQIADDLCGEGFGITTSALKYYLRKAKPKGKGKPKSRDRPPKKEETNEQQNNVSQTLAENKPAGGTEGRNIKIPDTVL
jgi:hypothetical protein